MSDQVQSQDSTTQDVEKNSDQEIPTIVLVLIILIVICILVYGIGNFIFKIMLWIKNPNAAAQLTLAEAIKERLTNNHPPPHRIYPRPPMRPPL